MASPQNGFTHTTSPVSASGDVLLDSLTGDYKAGGVVGTGAILSYSFPWSTSAFATWATDPNYSPLNEPALGFALNPMQQAAFRSALSTWSQVANLQFVEVPDNPGAVGDIRIAWTALPNPPSDAWTWQSDDFWASASDIWLSDALMGGQPDSEWQAGGFNYMALIHEVGHSLWLEHPFEGSSPMPANYDTNQYTVMSYTEHPNYLFVRYHPAVLEPDGSTTVSWDVVPIYPSTPMLLDIAAIQRLYGANMNWHTGDDVYAFNPDTPFIMTLWDAGGVDTISASNFSTNCLIDLREGHYSSLHIFSDPSITGLANPPVVPATPNDYDGTDNLAIAWGAVFENAVGGAGDDKLIGNGVANQLMGGGGTDILEGGQGIDTSLFKGTRGQFHLTKTAPNCWSAQDTLGLEGIDLLHDVERLQFADKKLALDLSPSEHAGQSLEFLGVLAPAAINNPEIVGLILGLFDQGSSLHDVFQLAIDVHLVSQLAGSGSNTDLARLAFRNIVGAEADATTLDILVSFIDGRSASYSQSDFLTVVAGMEVNQTHIDLIGWQQTGIEYV